MIHAHRAMSAALIATLLLAGCGVGVTPEARIQRAEELLGKGDYGAALLEIRNALQEQPQNAAAQLELARVALMMNDVDAASHSLELALANGADAAAAAPLRIQLLRQQGDNARLLEQLDAKSIPIDVSQGELARAQALAGLKRCPEAIRTARPLLADGRTLVQARIVLAECYSQASYQPQALELLQVATQRAPRDPEAWLALARIQQLSGNSAEAAASWSKAAEFAAGRLTALQQLTVYSAQAEQQLARGDFDAARATRQRMVRLAPRGALTQLLAARLQMADGKLEEAIAALLKLNVSGFDAGRYALASALLAADKREQARAEIGKLANDHREVPGLRSAAELVRQIAGSSAEKADYWLASAGTQVLLGQPAMARQALQRAATLAPESTPVAASRVQLELRTGNGAEAMRLAQELAKRHPDEVPVLLLLGHAQRMQRDFAAAADTLGKALARQPTTQNVTLLYQVRREIDANAALAVLETWLAQHPDDIAVRSILADSLMQASRNDEAVAAYEKILVKAPNNVIALNNLAWLYHLRNDQRALETARRGFAIAPNSVNVIDTYGWLLLESGANQEALKVLAPIHDSGVLIDPEGRYHYAAALARNGQADEARRQLALLLDEVPQFPGRDAAVALAANVK